MPRQPQTVYETVPTMAERAGDFSDALQSNGQPRPIYDPLTTTYDAATGTYTRQQFPGNKIPANRHRSRRHVGHELSVGAEPYARQSQRLEQLRGDLPLVDQVPQRFRAG